MVYTPIDPASAYDGGEFKEAFGKLKKIGGLENVLTQDNGNPNSIQGLGEVLRGDSQYAYTTHYDDPSTHVRNEAQMALRDGSSRMGEYVKNHADDVYAGLNGDSVRTLITVADPVANSGDQKYEKFVKALKKQREIQEISGDHAKMAEYVQEKINDSPDWVKLAFATYRNSGNYMERLFNGYAREVMREVGTQMIEITPEDMARFGKMVLENAKANDNKKFFKVLGEVAYAQMAAA
ncbi:hypothetical protein HYT24_03555 [Candidatus Pacearchaeota archaeon]|nr:hypothetical protein [Candidatus Pacearchaeota archaeon]